MLLVDPRDPDRANLFQQDWFEEGSGLRPPTPADGTAGRYARFGLITVGWTAPLAWWIGDAPAAWAAAVGAAAAAAGLAAVVALKRIADGYAGRRFSFAWDLNAESIKVLNVLPVERDRPSKKSSALPVLAAVVLGFSALFVVTVVAKRVLIDLCAIGVIGMTRKELSDHAMLLGLFFGFLPAAAWPLFAFRFPRGLRSMLVQPPTEEISASGGEVTAAIAEWRGTAKNMQTVMNWIAGGVVVLLAPVMVSWWRNPSLAEALGNTFLALAMIACFSMLPIWAWERRRRFERIVARGHVRRARLLGVQDLWDLELYCYDWNGEVLTGAVMGLPPHEERLMVFVDPDDPRQSAPVWPSATSRSRGID